MGLIEIIFHVSMKRICVSKKTLRKNMVVYLLIRYLKFSIHFFQNIKIILELHVKFASDNI